MLYIRYRGNALIGRLRGHICRRKVRKPRKRTLDHPSIYRTRTIDHLLCLTRLTKSTPIGIIRLSAGLKLRTVHTTGTHKRGGVCIRAYPRCLVLSSAYCLRRNRSNFTNTGCIVDPPLHRTNSHTTLHRTLITNRVSAVTASRYDFGLRKRGSHKHSSFHTVPGNKPNIRRHPITVTADFRNRLNPRSLYHLVDRGPTHIFNVCPHGNYLTRNTSTSIYI